MGVANGLNPGSQLLTVIFANLYCPRKVTTDRLLGLALQKIVPYEFKTNEYIKGKNVRILLLKLLVYILFFDDCTLAGHNNATSLKGGSQGTCVRTNVAYGRRSPAYINPTDRRGPVYSTLCLLAHHRKRR